MSVAYDVIFVTGGSPEQSAQELCIVMRYSREWWWSENHEFYHSVAAMDMQNSWIWL